MRVHVNYEDSSVVVPVPEAKLADFTVADLLAEASRRLTAVRGGSGGAKAEAEAEVESEAVVQLTKLTTASHGSVLLESDLVRDVLVHDEKLNAFSADKHTDEQHKEKQASPLQPTQSLFAPAAFPPSRGLVFPHQPPPMKLSAFNGASATTTGQAEENEVKTFTVSTKEVKNDEGEIESHLMVTIEDQSLKQVVNTFMNDEVFYEERPRVEAETLFCHLTQFKGSSNAHYRTILKPLVDWLDKQFEETNKKIARMLEEERLSFATLWYLFHTGEKVWGEYDDLIVGGEVKSTKYMGGFFPCFLIKALVVKSTGSAFVTREHTFFVPKFSGTRKLDELPVHKMTDDVMAKLTERGRRFEAVALGAHYKEYRGHMIFRTPWFVNKFKADGRVMIDGQSFNRMNPNYNEFRDHTNQGMMMMTNRSTGMSSNKIEADQLFMAWPTVGGFSFTAKQWGEILVDSAREVVFDDRAFERLVLAKQKKSLIRSLVENNHKASFSDVISGKGGGCIFLLHGKPGVGKTLTAEAIAELLHRPLYSVSVGELGTKTEELEHRLKEILEVASSWDAVILIDEADIFLERRTENDIKRNAMVGIFLRLLEYHQGVLFLTTNRVKSFDGAFHSRISVALKYSDLDVAARKKIWTNLLGAASVDATSVDVDKLSAYELNGRQIRTVIRLALSLATSEGVAMTDEHVVRTVSVSLQFKHDLDSMQADDCL